MKILLVEDEAWLVETMLSYFSDEGYLCEVAKDFEVAIEKINMYEYDCLLVDITLPDGNGLDVIEAYKSAGFKGGVIIISAKNALDDKIKGLDIGADDYLAKPFHLHELNARIKSLIRRLNFDGERLIRFNEITVNPESKTVFVNAKKVSLTRKEFELLVFFLQNPRRVLSKGAIAEHLWGDHMDMANSYDFIYSQIKNLRRKINQQSQANYFHAVYGVGYKLIED